MVTGYRDQARREDMKPEQSKENVKKRKWTRKGWDTFEPILEVKRKPFTPPWEEHSRHRVGGKQGGLWLWQ